VCAAGAQASVASTIAVNTTADNLPSGSECAGAPEDCSLRQALDVAHAGDTVQVPASQYLIQHARIAVRGGVTVAGEGDASTTINGGGTEQAFELTGGEPVTISGLTITETFNGSGEDQGGAINVPGSEAPLILEDVTISDSQSGVPAGFGGAIETGSNLTVKRSRFVNNSAVEGGGEAGPSGGGGAIDLRVPPPKAPARSLVIEDSVFVGNSTEAAPGGAILVERGDSLTVRSSTFIDNAAGTGFQGGAIELYPLTTASISNSTFTANAAGTGGAINMEGKPLALNGDTLAGNAAEVGANLAVNAGEPAHEATLVNTILATPTGGGANCSHKLTTLGHNLEDASPSSCGFSATAQDILGVSADLLPLAVNASIVPTAGGAPPTLALAAGSPALGAGDPVACEALGSVDERGFPRPGVPGGTCDVGAYERLPPVGSATTIAAAGSSASAGTQVVLTAAVAGERVLPPSIPGPGGTVEFRDGANRLATVPVGAGGQATLTARGLTVGEHSFTAVYSGDFVYAPSTSAPATLNVVAGPSESGAGTVPALSKVRQSHTTWRVGRHLASIARRHNAAPPVGTQFRFTLNTAATVTLSFARVRTGKMVGHRCVVPARRARHARACHRSRSAGRLTFAGHAGADVVSFDGWLSSHKRLASGRYAVTLRAANAAGRSSVSRLAFTVTAG